MIRGLVEKEWRQHCMLFVFMLLLLLGGLVMMQSNELIMRSNGSVFATVAMLLRFFLPVAGLVLGNALIAGEFRQRTQLFLEGLPMPRWLMLAVKYTLGLLVLIVSAELILGTGWNSAKGGEPMNQRFATLLAAKTAGWAWFCWSICFAHAFLGRYRIAVGMVIVIGLLWAENSAGVMVSRFGPFDLMGQRFAYERLNWPVEAMWVSLALIAGLTLLGFALGLVRDATVASMLSEKMSAREKLAISAMILVSIIMIGTVEEQKRDTSPLHLPGAVDVALRSATVSAAAAVSEPTDEEKAALESYARKTAELLASASDYLRCKRLPPLYLVHRRDMKEDEMEDGDLDSRQGYLLRLNMLTTPPDNVKARTRVLQRILDANQHYRLDTDSRGWVLNGFAAWWTLRDKAANVEDFIKLRTGHAEFKKTKLTGATLQNWLHFKNSVDEDLSVTYAGIGIMVLGEVGEQKRQDFLSTVLGYSAPHDFRASVHNAFNTVLAVLPNKTGLSLDEFAVKWSAALPQKEVKQ